MAGTARMKEVIPNINISQDERSDLIHAKKICIRKYKDGENP
jgi:hypothetical protein